MPRRKHTRRADVKDLRSILRLSYEPGLPVRAVLDRLQLSKTTVSTSLLRGREAGLRAWPLTAGHDDDARLAWPLLQPVTYRIDFCDASQQPSRWKGFVGSKFRSLGDQVKRIAYTVKTSDPVLEKYFLSPRDLIATGFDHRVDVGRFLKEKQDPVLLEVIRCCCRVNVISYNARVTRKPAVGVRWEALTAFRAADRNCAGSSDQLPPR